MSELVAFLEARISEDAAEARAGSRASDLYERQPHRLLCGWRLGESISVECECQYPARLLAECEAKRRIVDGCRRAVAMDDDGYTSEAVFAEADFARCILRDLVRPYATHPDYRSEWAP